MNISTLPADRQGALLSELFIGHIKQTLEKQAIDAIRPGIKAAVDAAVSELRPVIQTYLDPMKQEMLVRLTTHEVKA